MILSSECGNLARKARLILELDALMDAAIFLLKSRRDPVAGLVSSMPGPVTRFDVERCTFALADRLTVTASDVGEYVWRLMPSGWIADDFVSALLSDKSAECIEFCVRDRERREEWDVDGAVFDPFPLIAAYLSGGFPWMLVYLHSWEKLSVIKECGIQEALDYLAGEILGLHPARGFVCFGKGEVLAAT